MLIAVVAECTGSERTTLQLSNYSSGYYPQHFVLIDPWVSPSLKSRCTHIYRYNHKCLILGTYLNYTNKTQFPCVMYLCFCAHNFGLLLKH